MSIFPTSIATDNDLFVAVNYPVNQSTLNGGITASVATIPLVSAANFPSTGGFASIDSELIQYTGISGNSLTGCTRGVGGTTAASHLTGIVVVATVTAAHHNVLKDEIKAIETNLNLTATKVVISDSNGRLSTSAVTPTTLTYLDVGSSLTTLLSGKEPTLTKGNLTEATSSVLTISSGSNAVIGSGTTIEVKAASGSVSGYLSNTDWTTFNSKQAALTPGGISETTSSILTISNGSSSTVGPNVTIAVTQADSTHSGYLTSTDWGTFNSKQTALTLGNLSETTSSILTISGGTGAIIGSGITIEVKAASGSQAGYLSSTDWTTFNGKQTSLGFTPANITGDTFTGDVTLGNNKALILKETTGNGTDSVTLKAPASVTTSYIIQLPPAIAGAGQVLTDVAGDGVLSWQTPAGTGANTTLSNLTDTVAINKNLNNFSAGTITASLTGAASLNLLLTGGTLTGDVIVDNQKSISFRELTANGTNFVKVQAAASLTADQTYTLPTAYPTTGQALVSTDAGIMSWATIPTISPANLTSATSGVNVSGTGAVLTAASFTIDTASTSGPGLLSKADWDTFTAKQAALGYTPVNKAGDSMSGDLTLSNAKGIIFTEKSAGTDTITVRAPDSVTTSYTIQLPPAVAAGAGYVLTDVAGDGVLSWAAAAASGANTTLSNLGVVAINTSLISDTDNTDDLGSSAITWKNLYLKTGLVLQETGAGTDAVTISAPAVLTAGYSLVLPGDDGNNGQVLTTNGSGTLTWTTPAGTGASTTLNNLGTVACNTSLLSDATNTDDLGSSSIAWKSLYLKTSLILQESGAGTDSITLQAPSAITTGYTLTLPAAIGAAGTYLKDAAGNGVLSWATVASGDARIASFPVTPAAAPTCAGSSATNQLAIGDGAVIAGDNSMCIAIGKSYASTYGAIAIGIRRNTSSYGATGDYAIAMGLDAHATGQDSISIGRYTIAGGNNTIAIGYGAQVGSANYQIAINAGGATLITAPNNFQLALTAYGGTTLGDRNILIGSCSAAQVGFSGSTNDVLISTADYTGNDFSGEVAFATGTWNGSSIAGTIKSSIVPMWVQTTDATQTNLGTAGGSNTVPTSRIILTNNSTYIFDVNIVARKSTTGTDYSAWNLMFCINREANAASTALVGTIQKTLIGQTAGASTWDVTASADTTNGYALIQVTGQTSTTIRWVADVRMTKARG